jgi:hypothetical protein
VHRSRSTYSFSDDPVGGVGAAASTTAAAMRRAPYASLAALHGDEEEIFPPNSLTRRAYKYM